MPDKLKRRRRQMAAYVPFPRVLVFRWSDSAAQSVDPDQCATLRFGCRLGLNSLEGRTLWRNAQSTPPGEAAPVAGTDTWDEVDEV
jgi:hypothetical protein